MDFIFLLVAVPAIIVSLILIYVWTLQFKYRYAAGVPFAGISKYPLLINDWKLLRATPEGKFDILKDTFSQHDRLFKVWLGPRLAFGTCHPEVVQAILTHPECVEKPFFYRFARLDHGLLVGRAPLWKRQRKQLNSTFNFRILSSFVPIFEKCCQQLVNNLKPHENGEAFDVLQYTSRCTLSMVLKTSIGGQSLPVDESDNFVKHIKRFLSITTNRVLNLHQYWEPAYRWTKHYKMEAESQAFCESVTRKILRKKRAQINRQSNTDDDIESIKPRIFLDQLLQMSESLNEKEIIHNTFTMIAAGNDTSGQLMAYACLFLGMYPDVQEKVYEEIIDHIPTTNTKLDDSISVDQLKSLTYTEMFLNECLRLCPIGPNIARLNMAPIVLEGIKIPAGHFLFISFYALHRRKDIWGPDADLFDPERFSPERSKGRHPYAFLPFSGGSRNCIGWRYAMMSLKMMVIYLLRHYRLKTDLCASDFRFKFDMMLVLAFEHWLKIERRTASVEL